MLMSTLLDMLQRGLPQHHAYDLVWRHSSAVDATGERLAFGSTSGGLWISEDGRRFVDDAGGAAAAHCCRAFRAGVTPEREDRSIVSLRRR
jgi:hypothetical protein